MTSTRPRCRSPATSPAGPRATCACRKGWPTRGPPRPAATAAGRCGSTCWPPPVSSRDWSGPCTSEGGCADMPTWFHVPELTDPWFLLGLVVLLPLLGWYFYRSLVDFARWQRIVSLAARAVVVLLLVLSLAG